MDFISVVDPASDQNARVIYLTADAATILDYH